MEAVVLGEMAALVTVVDVSDDMEIAVALVNVALGSVAVMGTPMITVAPVTGTDDMTGTGTRR